MGDDRLVRIFPEDLWGIEGLRPLLRLERGEIIYMDERVRIGSILGFCVLGIFTGYLFYTS